LLHRYELIPFAIFPLVMHDRDKIMLGDDVDEPRQANDNDQDEDFLSDRGQEVFSLNLPRQEDAEEEYDQDEDDEEEDLIPVKKGRKTKIKPDVSTKGRYGKSDSDDSADEDAASSDDPDAESWGRSYYSRPSTRRGRDMEDDDGYGTDEDRKEEERMLEEKEVKRLQRKMRSVIEGDADWGFDELEASTSTATEDQSTTR
jgi:U3 small nucleolar RNA-associated protein 3